MADVPCVVILGNSAEICIHMYLEPRMNVAQIHNDMKKDFFQKHIFRKTFKNHFMYTEHEQTTHSVSTECQESE